MVPCPAGLSYLPYQVEGIRYAAERTASLIGDEPGLGKTIQAIGYLNCRPEVDNVLVVCTASMKLTWKQEMDKWLISPCVEVAIINYDRLHKLDLSREWDVLILDEAQYIKNKSAKRTKLVKSIPAKVKIALTGTPILNRPIELWSILNWLVPEKLPPSSYMKFALRYCGAHQRWVTRKKRVWWVNGASNLDDLKARLEPIMIRRLKRDVLKDLPPKIRQIVEIPQDGIDADLSRRSSLAALQIDAIGMTYKTDVDRLDSELTVAWNEMSALRHEIGLAKVDLVLPFLHDAVESSGKVVIFAHHRDVIENLKEALVDYNPVVIRGGTSLTDRLDAVDRFQKDPRVKVFIGQIQAAGTGITLTASSHVIVLEPDWTPGVMLQAEDRCHRIGTKDSVLVQHLVLENSLDARIVKTLVRKQEVIEQALNNN